MYFTTRNIAVLLAFVWTSANSAIIKTDTTNIEVETNNRTGSLPLLEKIVNITGDVINDDYYDMDVSGIVIKGNDEDDEYSDEYYDDDDEAEFEDDSADDAEFDDNDGNDNNDSYA